MAQEIIHRMVIRNPTGSDTVHSHTIPDTEHTTPEEFREALIRAVTHRNDDHLRTSAGGSYVAYNGIDVVEGPTGEPVDVLWEPRGAFRGG